MPPRRRLLSAQAKVGALSVFVITILLTVSSRNSLFAYPGDPYVAHNGESNSVDDEGEQE